MNVNVTSWGEVEITAETTITVNLDDVLNEASAKQLIDALDYSGTDWIGTLVKKQDAESILEEIDEEDLRQYVKDNGIIIGENSSLDDFSTQELVDELGVRDSIHEMLMCVSSDIIQEHMEKRRGGFTLENVPNEDLIGALTERDALPGIKISDIEVNALRVLFNFFTGLAPETKIVGKRFIIE